MQACCEMVFSLFPTIFSCTYHHSVFVVLTIPFTTHRIHVRVNLNLKTETTEDLIKKKKNMHLSEFRFRTEGTKRKLQELADHKGAGEARAAMDTSQYMILNRRMGYKPVPGFIKIIVTQIQDIIKTHEKYEDKYYQEELRHNRLVTQMLDVQNWAIEKMKLWLADHSLLISDFKDSRLEICHHRWLRRLYTEYSSCSVDIQRRKEIAIQILRHKGLLSSSDPNEMLNTSDHPLMNAAIGNCTGQDINVCLCPVHILVSYERFSVTCRSWC